MLNRQYRALLAHDPGTRLGVEPEELHQMRVATRRLRAFLRAARPLLDLEWAESLREELAWLGSALGPVRDLDVLIEHLRDDAAGLEAREQRALRRLFALLDEERERERLAMLDALGSERYLLLLDRLERDVAGAAFRRVGGRHRRHRRQGVPAAEEGRSTHVDRIRPTRSCTLCGSAASARATPPSSPSRRPATARLPSSARRRSSRTCSATTRMLSSRRQPDPIAA